MIRHIESHVIRWEQGANWREETEQIAPNIFSLHESINPFLAKIQQNPVGQRLLEKIASTTSTILVAPGHPSTHIAFEQKEASATTTMPAHIILCSLEPGTCFAENGNIVPQEVHTKLFHLLVHVYHKIFGKCVTSSTCDPILWGTTDEAYKVIEGFPSKKGKTTPKLTENAFRLAEGLPKRVGFRENVKNDPLLPVYLARIHKMQSLIDTKEKTYHFPHRFKSKEELGPNRTCAVFAKILKPPYCSTSKPSLMIFIDKFFLIDSLLRENCFFKMTGNTTQEKTKMKHLSQAFFPELENTSFKTISLLFVRISSDEHQALLHFCSESLN